MIPLNSQILSYPQHTYSNSPYEHATFKQQLQPFTYNQIYSQPPLKQPQQLATTKHKSFI